MKKVNFEIKHINYVWFLGIWFLLNFFVLGSLFNDYKCSFKSNLLEYILHIPFVYFNILGHIPMFVLKSKYIKYTISLSVSYILYDIEGSKFIPLIKGIDYIKIVKLRFENVQIRINLESDIDAIKVSPLLFISLIKNAFMRGGVNNFVITKIKKNKKGIGLSNTKNRLKLILKNNFYLILRAKFNFHIISLQIPLYNED
jgi:two-component system LytT family sensor kinase